MKKVLGSGHNNNTTTLIISNNEMEDIIEIAKPLEDSALLLKGVTETVQNEVNEQKGGFLSMLLSTLGTSLFGNLLKGRGVSRSGKERGAIAKRQGRGINRAGKGVLTARYGRRSFKMDF